MPAIRQIRFSDRQSYSNTLRIALCGFKNNPQTLCRCFLESIKKHKERIKSIDLSQFTWTRKQTAYTLIGDEIEVITEPHTDL